MPIPLRMLRKNAGFKSAAALATKIGVSKELVSKIEAGERSIENHIHKISEAIGVRPDDIEEYATMMSGMRDSATSTGWRTQADIMGWQAATIPIRGFVGAHQTIEAFNYGEDELERVPCPPGIDPRYGAAYEVLDVSGEPAIYAGWLVFIDRVLPGVQPEYIGELCMVKVLADGEATGKTLLKRIQRGSRIGHYTLTSTNPDVAPIKDVLIESSCMVGAIVPKKRVI